MSESEYIDYWEGLARRHQLIQHDPQTNPRFYVASDDNRSELEEAVRSKLKLPAIVIDQYYDDDMRGNDNFRLRILGGISVLTKCIVADPKDVRRARQEARAIARSFLNKMYQDCRPGGSLYARRLTPATDFEGEQAPTLAETATGWGYAIEWTVPNTIAVDENDWLPE